MKIKTIIAMLLVFGVFFNTTAVFAQLVVKQKKTLKLDKEKFAKRIKYIFDNQVLGYQAVLLKDGKIVAEVAGGEARRKIDGEQQMTVNTPSNIGSTAKFFAGTALLKLLSSPKGPINPSGRPFESWLDEKVFYDLPSIWKVNMHASWKQVTFRQLLQHKSGVRAMTTKEREDFVAQGYQKRSPLIYFLKPINEADRNVRDYENFNFTILTYLIPLIANPALRETLDAEIKSKKLKVDDLYITQRLGNEFEKYMRANLFGKITPKINPSCDAPNEYPKKNVIYAAAYKSMVDTSMGFEWSEREQNGSCYAQGGWYISAHELA
ncbi:MAG: serine hydrolase, partial [Pyrinomonadaceae bacterium]